MSIFCVNVGPFIDQKFNNLKVPVLAGDPQRRYLKRNKVLIFFKFNGVFSSYSVDFQVMAFKKLYK